MIELWLRSRTEEVADGRRPRRPAQHRWSARLPGLVVDDDPIVARRHCCNAWKISVIARSRRARQRLLCRCLSSEPGIDFVITDHAMPGMTAPIWPSASAHLAGRAGGAGDGYPEVPGDELGVPAPVEALSQAGTGPAAASMVSAEPPPLAMPPAAA